MKSLVRESPCRKNLRRSCLHKKSLCRESAHNILRVSENDLLASKVYILNLDVSYCSRPTATVQKKVNNNPVSILTEIAVGFWLLQEDKKFFVSIGFLHSLRSLVQFDIEAAVSFLITPREEDLQCASVTVD